MLLNSTIDADMKTVYAEMLMNDKWYLRVDEVLMVLARGAKGYYGVSNKNLNMEVVFSWFEKHEQERNGIFYSDHESKKHGDLNPNDRSPEPKMIKEVFDQAVDAKVEMRIEKYKEKAREKTCSDKNTEVDFTNLLKDGTV